MAEPTDLWRRWGIKGGEEGGQRQVQEIAEHVIRYAEEHEISPLVMLFALARLLAHMIRMVEIWGLKPKATSGAGSMLEIVQKTMGRLYEEVREQDDHKGEGVPKWKAL